jgi:hypothetical protein
MNDVGLIRHRIEIILWNQRSHGWLAHIDTCRAECSAVSFIGSGRIDLEPVSRR